MLQRLLIFIYFILLFAGTFTEQTEPFNIQLSINVVTNDEQRVRSSYLSAQQSDSNVNYRVELNNIDKNSAAQQQQQLVDSQSPIVRPVFIERKPYVARLASVQLAASEECMADIRKYCSGGGGYKMISNLKVLECVDDLDNAVNLIDIECQNLIYKYKYSITHDPRFDDTAMKQCSKDITVLEDCTKHTDELGSGRLVTCLYEHLANITESSCRYFINQLQAVVFNDWRLTEYFTDACMTDIKKLECGRLDDDNRKLLHEPGAVISCLSQKYDELNGVCRKEIFRLAEMQSDDYHLDRALYYACREDRERLCSQVASGNGRVYRCLYEQKFNSMMSPVCRKEVHRRQSLVVANVRTDLPLIRACNSEMREHQCSVDPTEQDKRSSLVKLLLCLGEKLKKGYHVQDECRRQMLIHRRMLMSDYELSKEIMFECKVEMIQHCRSLYSQGASGKIDSRGGRMIHCLLSAARKEKSYSPRCLSVVSTLMRAVDPGNDIRADPLLETACRPVIDTLCPRIKPGDSNIIMCLLDNLKSNRMTEECEDRLMEVAYFIARDLRLTPRLMRTCQTNLVQLCQLPKDWPMDKEMYDVQVGMYLGCLYQNRQQLETDCRSELKRLMYIRAQAIGLMPEVEQNCMIDLATCKNPEIKGEEMKCLQKCYEKLEPKCKEAVRKFTEQTMADPTFDFLLMKACEPMIQSYYSIIEGGKEYDLIRCLIKHKNEQKMDYRCKAGIDHHQITSMKDEAFLSTSFRKKCSQEVSQHCQGKKTKASVIQCLADLILRNVLKKQNEITEDCRDELKFELLQRSESIDFDPALAKACSIDIRQYCGDRTPGNAEILDCLKDNRNKVSIRCYHKLKRREKLDVIAPESDYSLMSKCATILQKTCSNEKKQNILSCLRLNINSDYMPNTCRRVLYHRLMILNSNARLNKGLIENCQLDINKHCKSEIVDTDDDNDSDEKDKDDEDDENNQRNENNNNDINDREMDGRVIQCLRAKYVDISITLDSQCITELIDVIQTSKLNVRLDVRLYQNCRKYLTTQCTGIDQEDCLKVMYQKNQISDDDCKEQVKRVIREERVYLNADHALFFACHIDILRFCNDIPIGNGKQLQCLLSARNLISNQCNNMLSKREDLWNSISVLNESNLLDVTHNICKAFISYSTIFTYVTYCVILVMFVLTFMAGYIYRANSEHNHIIDYKC